MACTTSPCPVPHQRSKRGGRSLHQHPSSAARWRAARGGTPGAQPRFAFSQRTLEMLVVPRPMRRFGEVPNHNGDGSPSEREALWWLKACATYVRHQVIFSGALILRHRRDPQRRKSSIRPTPAEATSWRSTKAHHFRFPRPLWHGPAPAASSSSASSWKKRSPSLPCATSSTKPLIGTRIGPCSTSPSERCHLCSFGPGSGMPSASWEQ